MKIKAEVIAAILFFSIWFSGYYYCNKHSAHNMEDDKEEKEINPRIQLKPTETFYGDSVYVVSKKVDTVYSMGQWIDMLKRNRKRRADSLHNIRK